MNDIVNGLDHHASLPALQQPIWPDAGEVLTSFVIDSLMQPQARHFYCKAETAPRHSRMRQQTEFETV
jgi:hypothetical protein